MLRLRGLAVILVTLFAESALSQENAGLRRIRIGMPNRGATTLGLTAAQAQGFFAHTVCMSS